MESGKYVPVSTFQKYVGPSDPSPLCRHPRMGFCVSSLVLGILSVITTLLPTAAFLFSIVGLTLGLLAYVDRKNSTARAGIFLNLLGLLLVI